MMSAVGSVVGVLALLALVALITFIERLLDLRHAQVDCLDFVKGVTNVLDAGNEEEALAICEDAGLPVANIVSAAIRHRANPARTLRDAVDAQGRAEIGRLDRRLASLAIIGQIAPVIGLLGTIIGFIRTLRLLDAGDLVSRVVLLGGAMDALVSAAAGLAVTIVVLVMYGVLRVRLDRIVVDLEAAASQIVGYLSLQREKELRK